MIEIARDLVDSPDGQPEATMMVGQGFTVEQLAER
jgi:hypothetical protein